MLSITPTLILSLNLLQIQLEMQNYFQTK